ncbi:MAG: hypothetical protein J6A59_16650 [Lachnospiraceae bacterium]|nr:hypothetical protein [Lachnospiraceae bacterium]
MEGLKVYGLSEELKSYRPRYNKEEYSKGQIEFIEAAIDKFNQVGIYRKNANERTKESFVANLLDPNFKVEKMRIILEAVIEMFNYISATQDDLSTRDVAYLCQLSQRVADAVKDPTYNFHNEEDKKEEVEEPIFDANKYLNKTMINLFEDED